MTSEPKTPGEVAWEAYRSALVAWAPGPPAGEGYISPAWEAAAQAVRLHLEAEQRRTEDLLSAHVIRDIRTISDIRRVLAEWRTIDPDFSEGGYYDCDAVNAICKILGEPTLEEAEACAEDAGAEQSKSPPPAER